MNTLGGFMKRNLEGNLKNLMDFLIDYKYEHDYIPSVREMAKHIGIKSTSTIDYYLNILEERNLIKRSREKNKVRAIEIVKETPKFVKYNEYCPDIINIPLVGTITAGNPILAVENIDCQFGFPEDIFGSEDLFMLNVTGESMIGAGIYNNDIIIVHRQSTAENGEIVAAMLDGYATVKRFFKEEKRIRLQPENPSFQPIYSTDVTVLGKVVGLIRKFRNL